MLLNLIKYGKLSYESTSKVLKSNYKTWNYETSFSYKTFPYKKTCINIVSAFLIINVQSVNITERVGKNFKKFPRIPRFRFQLQGQKLKHGIGRKFFTTCFTVSWTSLTSNKGPRNLLDFTCLLRSFDRISFNFEKGSYYSYLLFQN